MPINLILAIAYGWKQYSISRPDSWTLQDNPPHTLSFPICQWMERSSRSSGKLKPQDGKRPNLKWLEWKMPRPEHLSGFFGLSNKFYIMSWDFLEFVVVVSATNITSLTNTLTLLFLSFFCRCSLGIIWVRRYITFPWML